jgi:flagellar hook-basal body complex protein FliE
MQISTLQALRGYADARLPDVPTGSDGAAFAQTLQAGFSRVIDRLDTHEAAARSAMLSGGDPVALVTALAQTQSAVETVSAVRDRVVEAYQEILRMPV